MSSRPEAPGVASRGDLGAQTIALRVIAGLLIVGAMSMLASLLVPFFLALVLAIALSPLAGRIERLGVKRALSSLLILLLVAGFLAGAGGLVAYQVGGMIQESDRHLARFSDLLSKATERVGGDRLMQSFGYIEAESDRPPDGDGPGSEDGAETGSGSGEGSKPEGESPADTPAGDSRGFWLTTLRQNSSSIGHWLATGIGGVVGVLGGLVLTLAFLYYMLDTRADWVARLRRSLTAIGMRPRPESFEKVQGEVGTFVGCLAMVSVCFCVVISLATWAIGVPQPLFWGVLTGLLEVVPYFGPISAGTLTTLAALSAGGSWWQPAAVVVLFLVLQTVEGYVIAPKLYGKAIRIDPVTVLVGVLFFGWLWGPVGLALAMPMMIVLRGLIAIAPDVPAMDALVEDNAPDAESVRA